MSVTREVRFKDFDRLDESWDVRVVTRGGDGREHVVYIDSVEHPDELTLEEAKGLLNLLHSAVNELHILQAADSVATEPRAESDHGEVDLTTYQAEIDAIMGSLSDDEIRDAIERLIKNGMIQHESTRRHLRAQYNTRFMRLSSSIGVYLHRHRAFLGLTVKPIEEGRPAPGGDDHG